MPSKDTKACTRVTISLNDEVLAELDKRCEELDCPRSVYISLALKAKWQSEENMKNVPAMLAMMGELAGAMNKLSELPPGYLAQSVPDVVAPD